MWKSDLLSIKWLLKPTYLCKSDSDSSDSCESCDSSDSCDSSFFVLKIVTKLKNPNCYKTSKLKLWQYSKTQFVTKLENSTCDKTQKLKLWWNWKKHRLQTNSKTQNVKKRKKKLNLWPNFKTQVVTKLKNKNCEKVQKKNCDKSQKLKSWQLWQ